MDGIKIFLEKLWGMQIVTSVVIIMISILMYKGLVYFINKSENKNKSKLFTSNKSKTYAKLMRNVIRYVFIILTSLIVLQVNGVNVSSLLAGVGIVGAVLGLAVQDWLKDVIRGSSILSDEYFSVGDIVKYKDIEGKVLIIGLKTTKIQDLKTNNVISIANRNIEQIEVVSDVIYVRIPMPYEVKVEKAEKAVEDIIKIVKQHDNVNDCVYKGVADLKDSSIEYLLEVNCNPINKLQVRRDTLKSILLGLEANKISVPYNQIDVHTK